MDVTSTVMGRGGGVFLMLAAVLVVATTQQTFASEIDYAAYEQHAQRKGYASSKCHGVGSEFSRLIMHEAQFKFAMMPGNEEYASWLDFDVVAGNHLQCRMDGYLDYCKHPFLEGITEVDALERFDMEVPYHADYVITDEPMFSVNSPDIQNFPLFVSGYAPVFNIPGVDKLVLDKSTLAKIFRGCSNLTSTACLPGSITSWSDPAIKRTNPTLIHTLLDQAGAIKVIVQNESASSSAVDRSGSLRRALSRFETAFAQQIGYSDSNNGTQWPGTNHIRIKGGMHGLLKAVKETPNSISYTKVNIAREQTGVLKVDLLQEVDVNTTVVSSSDPALYAAFQEIGLDFGNDGRDPDEYTVDLTGAKGRHGWPIDSMVYLSLRTNSDAGRTLEEGSALVKSKFANSSCLARKRAMLKFFEFLYTSQGSDSTLFDGGFAAMTPQAGLQILRQIQTRLTCYGEMVHVAPPALPRVTIQAEEALHEALHILGEEFQENHASDVKIVHLESHIQIQRKYQCLGNSSCAGASSGLIILADENLSTHVLRDAKLSGNYELISMPFCAMATGFIYSFCGSSQDDTCPYRHNAPLTLDMETAARIFDEEIRYWNDSRIQALNPGKLLPNEPIRVISGPKASTFHFSYVNTVRQSYLPTFAFSGGGSGMLSYLEAWIEVSLTPFTISFVPFNGTVIEGVNKVSLVNRQAKIVEPSTANIEACATDTYDPETNLFFLSSSQHDDCWPLVQVFNLHMQKRIRFPQTGRFADYLYNRAIRRPSLLFDTKRRRLNQAKVVMLSNETSSGLEHAATTVLSVSDLGTLVDVYEENGFDLAERNFLELESLKLLDGSSVVRVDHDLNLIPNELIIAMYFLTSLEVFCFVSLAIWVFVHHDRKLIRNSSPIFMYQVLFGASVMAMTVIPLAQQDSYLTDRGMTLEALTEDEPELDAACVASPAVFSLGFFITFSALFLKSWRLIRIFNNKKLRNLFLKDRQLLIYQAMVITVVIILNLVWAIIEPLEWVRFPIFINEQGLVVASYGICFSHKGIYPALPLLIGVMLVLLLGNYLSYLGRRIPTEFNESKWVAMSMILTLEAFVMGLLILAMANSQPVAGFIIKSFCSLLVSGATVALIFAPKVAMAYGWGVIEGESNPWRFVKKGDSGSGSHGASNGAKKSGSKVAVVQNDTAVMTGNGINSTHNQHHASGITNKVKSFLHPSLNSLVDGKVTVVAVSDSNKTGQQSPNPVFRGLAEETTSSTTSAGLQRNSSKRGSKEFANSTLSEALSKVLQDDPMRRRFRRYLQTLKMEENVRFWDSVLMFRAETDNHRRYVSARAIIQTFVLDSSPLQVNLSSTTKQEIMSAFQSNDKTKLASTEFFHAATHELFEDLRQSDAFRKFLENDTFSSEYVGSGPPTN